MLGSARPFFVAILCLSVLACSATAPGKADIVAPGRQSAYERQARLIVSAMTDGELAGQVLMTGADGVERLSAPSRTLLLALKPGAILLFGYNLSSNPKSVAALAADIRAAAAIPTGSSPSSGVSLPPFIAIDHEGGGVYRFKGGLTRLPAAQKMGSGVSAMAQAVSAAAGKTAGTELRALGITMNLAPVVEALTTVNVAFLGDRAWSEEPAKAATLAALFIESCQEGGVAAAAKHFPGNAAADPHRGLPVLRVTRAELEGDYLPSFGKAIRSGVAAVMLSHAIVPAIDPGLPSSLSARAIGLLKGELGFRGIVMTDDLVMAALSGLGGPGEVAVKALTAGADMLMVSGGRAAGEVREALLAALADGSLGRDRLRDAAARIVAQKLRYGLDSETDDERGARLGMLESIVARNGAALSEALAARD